MRLEAIIFDVDGTLAETEETHRAAFNRSFADAGLDWQWSEDDYRALLTTTGGKERIARHMREVDYPLDPRLIATLHARKNSLYAELVGSGSIVPRTGILPLIEEARRSGIRLAIATTTSRANLTALLQHAFAPNAERWFSVIVAGEDVERKKPDPEVYLSALDQLALDPAVCVVIEDTRNGLEAALGAGLSTVITPSHYSRGESFEGAARIVEIPAVLTIESLEAILLTPPQR